MGGHPRLVGVSAGGRKCFWCKRATLTFKQLKDKAAEAIAGEGVRNGTLCLKCSTEKYHGDKNLVARYEQTVLEIHPRLRLTASLKKWKIKHPN